jgi:dienelactone hydrolase
MMDGYSVETLGVQGYDAQVPNNHWTNGSETLLIMLPGLGYTNEMPLLFYLRESAMRRSWDVLQVNYDYRAVPRDTSAEEWSVRMVKDSRPVIDAALAKGHYKHVVLAGKSIGTSVMSALLRRGFDKATAYIWLTPLLRGKPVHDAVTTYSPSVAVFGDADYAVDGVNLAPIAQTGVRMIVMPGGDHGMMTQATVPESIAALAQVMHELEAWLNQNVASTGDTE